MSKKECKYCGSTKYLEIEHIKAQSKGGAQTVLACRACNRSKQDKSLLTWLRWIKKNDRYRWRRIRDYQYRKRGDIADTVRKVSNE